MTIRQVGRPHRIAVLGAGGFVGSHLVPALAARGDVVIDAVDVTLDKLPPTPAHVTRIQASIGSAGLLDQITARCDTVVSLTALCNPALYNTRPLDVIDASFTDLLPLVKLCAARARWLIHFSTCEVYGRVALDSDGRPSETMNEDASGLFLGPVHKERWTYACAKQLAERVIFAHGRHGGLPFTIIRPFNVIGPRMDFVPGIDGEGVPRVLASFMSALLRGDDLLLVDSGRQRRSFVSVAEFVDAIVRVIDRPHVTHGEILNLGHPGNDVSIRSLALALVRAYGQQVPGARVPRLREITAESLYGPGYDDSIERIPDIDKARRLLDWEPRVTLDEMLPGIVADYVARYGAAVNAQGQRHAGE